MLASLLISLTSSFAFPSFADVNEAPQNITLSNNMVRENSNTGTVIGDFHTIDPDSGDTFTYSFPPGVSPGLPLTISGNKLEVSGPLDYESNNTYAIDVASKDQGGLEVVQAFTIYIEGEHHLQ